MHQLKLLELESKKRKQAKSFLIREALSEHFSQKTHKSRIVGSFYALSLGRTPMETLCYETLRILEKG